MMYLSKGILMEAHGNEPTHVSRCGRIYALGPELTALWKDGQFAPHPVPAGRERAIRRLEDSGLVATTEESGTLASYRLFIDSIICPNSKRWTDRFLPESVRRIWTWLNEAGLRLTASELIRLEERQVKPTQALLGEDGRQNLTEMIYFADTIPDGILETMMEHSAARDNTVDALLQLLRTRRLLLI